MLPYVILYNAVSLDGRTTGFNADVELYYELASKWNVDAVLAGINTILTGFNAQPGELREEGKENFKPPKKDPDDDRTLLVIPDSKGQVRIWNEVRKMPYIRDILVLCSRSTSREYLDFLDERYIDYLIVGYQRVDLEAALEELNTKFGVKSVRVDSGGLLNGALIRAGLVDEVHLLIHPQLVGGVSPNSIYQNPDLDSSDSLVQLKLAKMEKVKDHIVWLQYKVVNKDLM
jgi:2,5-diamino-6-(ribosylamino)-4(3H)-pyrimidinone 5'-phosphate reductase